jgi:hypothetical protein
MNWGTSGFIDLPLSGRYELSKRLSSSMPHEG